MAFFGLFGPPNVEKLKAKGDAQGLIEALRYKESRNSSKASDVREAAVWALMELRTTYAVVEPLIARLADKDKDVRKAAVRALWQPNRGVRVWSR